MKVLWLLALVGVAWCDPCAPHPNCAECVADTGNVCGWCSENVVYKNGSTGVHCVSNNGANPFACFGIFSTESCVAGYICDPATHTCIETNPGEGVPLDTCARQCGASPTPPAPSPTPPPPADTYECNHTDYKCYKSTPGHGGSLEVCEQGCHPATPAAPAPPTPPTPPPPPAATYECNMTDLTCFKSQPGKGSSLEVCMKACSVPPVPPPISGKWRGLQTDNQYAPAEYDLELSSTSFKLTSNGTVVHSGTVVGNSKPGQLEFTFETGVQVAAIYSESKGVSMMHMTIVMGKDASDVPTGWDLPWIAGGSAGSEWVFVQML